MAVTRSILDLQADIRGRCDQFGKLYDITYFDQGIWKPECQLTIGFENEKLKKSVEFLSNIILFNRSNITDNGNKIIKFQELVAI